jgi:adenylate cyclase class IV
VPVPEALGAVLIAACGAERVVRKRRTRLVLGPASVHLDEVEGLGRFIEVGVAVDAATPTEHAAALAEENGASVWAFRRRI